MRADAWHCFVEENNAATYLTILHRLHVVSGPPMGEGHAQYAHDVHTALSL